MTSLPPHDFALLLTWTIYAVQTCWLLFTDKGKTRSPFRNSGLVIALLTTLFWLLRLWSLRWLP